jgi:hypothetical protein
LSTRLPPAGTPFRPLRLRPEREPRSLSALPDTGASNLDTARRVRRRARSLGFIVEALKQSETASGRNQQAPAIDPESRRGEQPRVSVGPGGRQPRRRPARADGDAAPAGAGAGARPRPTRPLPKVSRRTPAVAPAAISTPGPGFSAHLLTAFDVIWHSPHPRMRLWPAWPWSRRPARRRFETAGGPTAPRQPAGHQMTHQSASRKDFTTNAIAYSPSNTNTGMGLDTCPSQFHSRHYDPRTTPADTWVTRHPSPAISPCKTIAPLGRRATSTMNLRARTSSHMAVGGSVIDGGTGRVPSRDPTYR